jgi:hypothetical protein
MMTRIKHCRDRECNHKMVRSIFYTCWIGLYKRYCGGDPNMKALETTRIPDTR